MSPIVQVSWTHALRQIVINCYKYHGREDLLPAFTNDDDKEKTKAAIQVQTSAIETLTGAQGVSDSPITKLGCFVCSDECLIYCILII